jgi:nucleotide-binding universal stress UspA family protein
LLTRFAVVVDDAVKGVNQEVVTMDVHQILAPTDFSESSKQAIAYAWGWAQTFRAKLLLLHVVALPTYAPQPDETTADLITALLDELKREANVQMAQLLPEAGATNVDVTRRVVVGVPYETILETVGAESVDLIVMATHGRTGLRHLLMGSVAERVVRLAPCPVLTVRVTAS